MTKQTNTTRWLIGFLREEGFIHTNDMPKTDHTVVFNLFFTGVCDGLYAAIYQIPGSGRDFSMIAYYAEIVDAVAIDEQHYVNHQLDVSITGIVGLTSLDHSIIHIRRKRARRYWRVGHPPSYVGGVCRD